MLLFHSPPHPTVSFSREFTIHTVPPTSQLTLNVTKPRPSRSNYMAEALKLQPWFLSQRWKTCLRQNCSLGSYACLEGPAFGQNTGDCCHESRNFLFPTIIILVFCPRQVLHFKGRNLGFSSAEGRSSTANSPTKAAVSPGIEQVWQLPVAFRTSLSLSLESEQTLKDLKRSQRHQRGGEEIKFG